MKVSNAILNFRNLKRVNDRFLSSSAMRSDSLSLRNLVKKKIGKYSNIKFNFLRSNARYISN